MSFQTRINNWFKKFRKYLLFYRDGYFELPYLSNSPELMIESLKRVPFTKHDPSNNTIQTKSIFSEGTFYYRKISDGLWVLVSEITFKKHVATKALKDKGGCDYYFLNHFRYSSRTRGITINGLTIPKQGWSISKPGTEVNSYFNPGDSGVFINIAFNEEWLKKNIRWDKDSEFSSFKKFIDSNNTFKTWADIIPEGNNLTNNLLNYLRSENESLGNIQLSIVCLQLIASFLAKVSKSNYSNAMTTTEADRRLLAKAEKLITDSVTQRFPGIDTIAAAVSISPTKLKTIFKATYGVTMFQYYQDKQMKAATELLNEGRTVKEVALMMGYDNQSNFRAAFKKHYGYNPSNL
ncbi:helix-turn-helix domain-containing protein [Desertivirga brevis]|uniref:helix-turn-helix domain-containing protein n=1 Tax=Desertivirga brevis TaxID=2810310 RepID=UPI001A9777C2|nr:AraC family transcriptional regulator [Pedobacter sp. SYSU D00873]